MSTQNLKKKSIRKKHFATKKNTIGIYAKCRSTSIQIIDLVLLDICLIYLVGIYSKRTRSSEADERALTFNRTYCLEPCKKHAQQNPQKKKIPGGVWHRIKGEHRFSTTDLSICVFFVRQHRFFLALSLLVCGQRQQLPHNRTKYIYF